MLKFNKISRMGRLRGSLVPGDVFSDCSRPSEGETMAGHTGTPSASGALAEARSLPLGTQLYVLFVGSLVLFTSQGLCFGGLTVFDSAILDELGISVAELKFRDTIQNVISALLAAPAGFLIDRIGVKLPLIVGFVIMSLCFFIYSTIDSVGAVYWNHFLMGVGLKGAGMMVAVILVSQWFGPWRGRALGVLVSGSSLGNALVPQFNTALLSEFAWREAFLVIAVIPLLLLPLLALLPGRSPYLDTAPEVGGTAQASAPGSRRSASYSEAVRSSQFWLLGIIAFTTFFSLMGSSANFVLHMQRDLGLPLERADDSLFILFIVAIITKLAGGVLADRFGPKRVLITCLAVMMAGAYVLTLMSTATVWFGIALFGLGWGALYTCIQLLPSHIFGLASLGKVMGTLIIFETTAGAFGAFTIGLGYDRTGSYQFSFQLMTGMLALAVISAFIIKVPNRAVD
jgi:MFS family permease